MLCEASKGGGEGKRKTVVRWFAGFKGRVVIRTLTLDELATSHRTHSIPDTRGSRVR